MYFNASILILQSHLLKVKVIATQSCPTLCDPWILQARILEWVAIHFFRDLPNAGLEPWSPALQADSLTSRSLFQRISFTIPLKSINFCFCSFKLYLFYFLLDSPFPGLNA